MSAALCQLLKQLSVMVFGNLHELSVLLNLYQNTRNIVLPVALLFCYQEHIIQCQFYTLAYQEHIIQSSFYVLGYQEHKTQW